MEIKFASDKTSAYLVITHKHYIVLLKQWNTGSSKMVCNRDQRLTKICGVLSSQRMVAAKALQGLCLHCIHNRNV